ncbi:nuclear body protein SP140-like protein isoform X2 [Phodopus roborovskii]|uniref:nuclear body protein SP140-like protein isoform X2 n=1 Tax=Phodopus roborovskii TaxID=109678 RepID=UPI0021E3F232|nr:nuclear body protein SP140-like protein isoform X2 [Phodopus roborovskii]
MEQEDTERRPFERVFLYFKKNKVKISTAIKKPFPFFEFLRDNELITNKMYDDFQDSYSNLVPLQKVVYRALEELEKRLDLVVLRVLFSEENLRAYPDLELILQSFENVLQNKLCSHESDRGDPNSQLSLEQGRDDSSSQQSLTWSPLDPSSSDGQRISERRNATIIQGNQTENHQSTSFQIDNVMSLQENGLSEDQATTRQGPDSEPEESCELEVQLSNSDPYLEPHSPLPWNEERAEVRSQGTQIYPCSVHLVDIKQEKSLFVSGGEETEARTSHNQEDEVIVLSSEDSNDGSNCWEESTPVICQSKSVDSRKTFTFRKTLRRRGPRIPRQHNVDFSSPELPVTCGIAKGILYKNKFEEGIHVKSIRNAAGEWFALREFEIIGKREQSKNWKQSIRSYGWTLKELIERGALPSPPSRKGKKKNTPNPQRTKRKLENSKQCTVCGQRRRLYHCTICRKFYHKRCHIPPVEVKRGLWSCVFCKTKDQLRCQENQARLKESEVLRWRMLPEKQLKCELLLLTMYCHSKSRFFIHKPKQNKADFPGLKNMWLNKIKYRLEKKAYHSVQRFVEDMRLIFQNHSIFYQNHKFNNLGVTVGGLFEKTFKRIFSIEDTSK